MAHSTSVGSLTVDIVVDHDDVFQIHHRQRGEQRVLAFAGLFLDRDHRVPKRAAAERDVDILDLDSGGAQRRTDGGVARRRREPGVLPRHVQIVVDRVLAHRNRLDAHQRIPVQPAHQAGEFAEAAFRKSPAGRQHFRLEHDLGVGNVRHVDGLARRQLKPARRGCRRRSPSRRRRAARDNPSR